MNRDGIRSRRPGCRFGLARGMAAFMVLGWAFWMTPATSRADPPSVVVLLADDAGWGDFGFNGNRQLETPNIDRIAREGAVLDRFYVCPVCSPTRAEWLTGRYHLRGGVLGVSTGQERLDLDERTVADAFQAAGYATGAFGKWHNGSQWPYHPMARGFDEYYGHTSGHWGEYFDPELELAGKMIREKGYIVDLCTDRAVDFIRRNADSPFFCYIPFTTPHSPWAVPAEDWERFRDRPITQLASQPDREVIDHTRCALAMMENQDRNVGKVLDTLERLGLTESTIVVYFSDNGPNSMRWNGGMRGRKGTTDEGGVRSPGFIRWPSRITAGTVVPEITAAIDLLPTLLSLADIPRVGDKPLDGVDLSPLLLADAAERSGSTETAWSDRMIFSTWAGRTSVRTPRHRMDDQGRLYDLTADPGQRHDLSQSDPETADKLRRAVAEWMAEMRAEVERKPGREPIGETPGTRVDPRPLPVGYPEFPITILPARDGRPIGQVARSSSAPNSSYFVNWSSTEDRIVWNVAVQTAGWYDVVIDYTCPLDDAGSLIELSLNGQRLRGEVSPGFDPPLYDNQDTLPRPAAESRMKPFRQLSLGRIRLDAGEGELTLRANEIPGDSVMDLRRLTVTLETP